jgi:hypothetical protein
MKFRPTSLDGKQSGRNSGVVVARWGRVDARIGVPSELSESDFRGIFFGLLHVGAIVPVAGRVGRAVDYGDGGPSGPAT